jgi:hypothetical protein
MKKQVNQAIPLRSRLDEDGQGFESMMGVEQSIDLKDGKSLKMNQVVKVIPAESVVSTFWAFRIKELKGMLKHRPGALSLWSNKNHPYLEGMFAVIISRFVYREALVASRTAEDWSRSTRSRCWARTCWSTASCVRLSPTRAIWWCGSECCLRGPSSVTMGCAVGLACPIPRRWRSCGGQGRPFSAPSPQARSTSALRSGAARRRRAARRSGREGRLHKWAR